MRSSSFLRLFSLVLLLSLVATTSVLALALKGEEAVVIGANEIAEDDLYIGASTFVLDGVVKGDLTVVAQTITINGSVEGDLMAFGQVININGSVTDDARIAGQVLNIGGRAIIGDDLLSAGLSLESRRTAAIGGDLVFGGAQALLNGNVAGNMMVVVSRLQLGGQVGGNMKAVIRETREDKEEVSYISSSPPISPVSPGLTFTKGASVAGSFEYTSDSEFEIPAGTVLGEITHRLPAKGEVKVMTPTEAMLAKLSTHTRRYASLVIIGLLMAWLIFEKTKAVSSLLATKPWPALGFGLIAFAAFFVWLIVIFLAMIILASALALFGFGGLSAVAVFTGLFAITISIFLFVLLISYIAKIVVSMFIGGFVLERAGSQMAQNKVWPILIGLLVYALLTAIPIIGGLLNFIIILMGLGAIWLSLSTRLTKEEVYIN